MDSISPSILLDLHIVTQRGTHVPPKYMGGTWVYRWSKLQIQEKWCVCCKVTKVENDRLVPMFGCVCIPVSDQSPSTKVCNKEDCRNQVV